MEAALRSAAALHFSQDFALAPSVASRVSGECASFSTQQRFDFDLDSAEIFAAAATAAAAAESA
eukprot:1054024-Pyramimonas_sp.AAC.1